MLGRHGKTDFGYLGLSWDEFVSSWQRPGGVLGVAEAFPQKTSQILLSFIPKSSQNRPKSSQNPPQDPPKTAPKRRLMLETPKLKNNATLPRFCSFLTFQDLRKSSQNRCQNAFKIGLCWIPSWSLKKYEFLMLKRHQDGPPKFI